MEKQELNEIKQDVKDIKESVDFLIKNSATKSDLDEKLNGFATKSDLDEKFNTVMNGIDSVMGELTSKRQEDIMKVGRDDNQDEEIGKVKNRVTNVEYHIGIEPLAA